METSLYPIMSLRDIVIFPHMVAPLVVGRSKSIHALEDAMEKRTEILLVSQQDSTVNDPTEDEIYRVGTLAVVMQLLRLPDGTIKALVEGKRRAEIVSFLPHEKFMQAEVFFREDTDAEEQETEVFTRRLRKQFEQFAEVNRKIPREVLKSVKKLRPVANLSMLSVLICQLNPMKNSQSLRLILFSNVLKRF